MASFSVNGVAANTTSGAATVATSSNSFTISWSGLDNATNYEVYFRIMLDSYDDLTYSDGTDWWLFYYTTEHYGSGNAGYNGYTYKVIGTSGSDTVSCSSGQAGKTLEIAYRTTFDSATYYITFVNPTPSITAQPSITSMSPTSGQSTTIQWSAASVSNQGSATIYYQYFVGPSSTYSDSYHIGTTTGLTATITEANILAKCGSNFSGTCYVFVRAYWDNGSTTGGWSTPTGKAFSYTPHRTVKYFNGSSWVECIPYYFNGSSWVECIPYYFNGSSWVECSH